MTKYLYAVILIDSLHADLVLGLLSAVYGSDVMQMEDSDTTFLVRTTDGVKSVAKTAGLDEDRPGIVFKLESGVYTGFMPKDFWKWLRLYG